MEDRMHVRGGAPAHHHVLGDLLAHHRKRFDLNAIAVSIRGYLRLRAGGLGLLALGFRLWALGSLRGGRPVRRSLGEGGSLRSTIRLFRLRRLDVSQNVVLRDAAAQTRALNLCNVYVVLLRDPANQRRRLLTTDVIGLPAIWLGRRRNSL